MSLKPYYTKVPYKCWSAAERNDRYNNHTRHKIGEGKELPPPSECTCKKCGQGEKDGKTMEYHNENYDYDTLFVIPLCKSCHEEVHKQAGAKCESCKTK